MRTRSHLASLASAAALLLAPDLLAAHESAEAMPERLPLLTPAIVEYRWKFLVPEWIIEPHNIDARIYAPTSRVRHVDYRVLEVEQVRRWIGRVPEFSCKYPAFELPNECRTTWRDVYVDIPMPVLRRDYIELDVPEWSWQDRRTIIDVPRLVWKEETLVVSLPALAVRAAPTP